MKVSDFTSLLEYPGRLNSPVQAHQLEEVLEAYPWFQAARALHLIGAQPLFGHHLLGRRRVFHILLAAGRGRGALELQRSDAAAAIGRELERRAAAGGDRSGRAGGARG